MKRLNAIIRCEKITDVFDRRGKRLMRQIDQAIDSAKDAIADMDDKIEEKINSFGLVSGADQTNGLQIRINEYIDLCDEREAYLRSVDYLEQVKVKLNEEVEVIEDSDPTKPVKTSKTSK